jgi:two-component system, NarL family, nitrate/nitrite response regulator NarL
MLKESGKSHKEYIKIIANQKADFRVAIVGQDPINSALLVDTTTRCLSCDAIGALPSELMQMLGMGDISLVIINENIGSSLGAGYELTGAVSSSYPEIPIVVMIEQPSSESTINALSAGARGLFNRQQSISELIDCIEHVRKGAIWAGPEETRFLLQAFKNLPALGARTGIEKFNLTVRELQVVRAAACGKTNKEIGVELRLSEHTVKNYMFRAFEKLGVSSRIELLFFLTTRERTFDSTRSPLLK